MPPQVLVALRVKASPERAFAAFTDEIGLWWCPNGLFQFHPLGTGRLSFEPGVGGRPQVASVYPYREGQL